MPRIETLLLTVVTLIAFAANSVLCRMAIKADLIDPASFTEIRLAAGAAALAPLLFLSGGLQRPTLRHVSSALALFIYAIAFSIAYVRLDAGVGALVLFGAVQFSMIGFGIAHGRHPAPLQWTGLTAAFGGLVYLFLPGLSAPPIAGAVLMGAAGLAWGAYSLLGRGESDPVAATARNFVLTLPFVLLLLLLAGGERHIALEGALLAVASGAVASGAGYVVWYKALKGLSPVNAAIVQLAVPVIAALGGVVFLDESLTLRLLVAAALILGGIYLAMRPAAPSRD